MINLIPPKAKKSLLIEYWVRVISTWLTLWAFALFASAGIALPVYVLIGEKVEVYAISAVEALQKVGEYEDVSSALVRASQQARIIIDETSQPIFSEYIALFEESQGQGVYLNMISISRDGEGVPSASLAGTSDNRKSLASFRDRLLAEPVVTDVNLPISNLAEDKNIKFNITITLDNEIEI